MKTDKKPSTNKKQGKVEKQIPIGESFWKLQV
jgi:hypothetical protein